MRVNAEKPKREHTPDKPALPSAGTTDSVMRRVSQLGRETVMSEPVLRKMNNAFGADFSNVVIHESPIVEEMGAEAASMGSHVAFAPGKYRPESTAGQALLGHELAHVVQQAEGRASGTGFLNDSSLESAADMRGVTAARGQSVSGAGPAPTIPAMSHGTAAPVQAKKKDRQAAAAPQQAAPPTPQQQFDSDVGNIARELQAKGPNPNTMGGDSPATRYTNTLVSMGWRQEQGSKPKADRAFKQLYGTSEKAQQKLQATGLGPNSFDRYENAQVEGEEAPRRLTKPELATRSDYAGDVGRMNDIETGMLGEMMDDPNMQKLLRAKYQGFAALSPEARAAMGGESGVMSALLSDMQLRMTGPALGTQRGMTLVSQGSMAMNNYSSAALLNMAGGGDFNDLTDEQLAEVAGGVNARLSNPGDGQQHETHEYTNAARLRQQIAMMNRIRGIVTAPEQQPEPAPEQPTAHTVDDIQFGEGVHSRPAYATIPVPEEVTQESPDDERLAALYHKIKNPDPNEDPGTVSHRKRVFAELRAQQMAREQTPAAPKKKKWWQRGR